MPPGLLLSFQRYARPDAPAIDRAPASLGSLPIGFGLGGVVLPLAANECFWIGLRSEPGAPPISMWVSVVRKDGRVLDALSGRISVPGEGTSIVVRDAGRIEGVQRVDGTCDVFARSTGWECDASQLRVVAGPLAGLGVRSDGAETAFDVWLVDYARFARTCGLPPPSPLDLDAGYKGWRLP